MPGTLFLCASAPCLPRAAVLVKTRTHSKRLVQEISLGILRVVFRRLQNSTGNFVPIA